jgi:hypothetical protein
MSEREATTLYLERSKVREVLIGQPDETLQVTESILCEIDALPAFTAADIGGRAKGAVKLDPLPTDKYVVDDPWYRPAQGTPDPEVVAAVQEAIMKHPFWKPGLGSSGFAFGLANTAIEAYVSALSTPSTEGK